MERVAYFPLDDSYVILEECPEEGCCQLARYRNGGPRIMLLGCYGDRGEGEAAFIHFFAANDTLFCELIPKQDLPLRQQIYDEQHVLENYCLWSLEDDCLYYLSPGEGDGWDIFRDNIALTEPRLYRRFPALDQAQQAFTGLADGLGEFGYRYARCNHSAIQKIVERMIVWEQLRQAQLMVINRYLKAGVSLSDPRVLGPNRELDNTILQLVGAAEELRRRIETDANILELPELLVDRFLREQERCAERLFFRRHVEGEG